MSEFAFIKGGDVTVKLNSDILGGVSKAGWIQNNSFSAVEQFLTDVPVYWSVQSDYTVTLVMNCADSSVFDNMQEFDILEFCYENGSTEFENCRLQKIESAVTPTGALEYTVIIKAETRNEK